MPVFFLSKKCRNSKKARTMTKQVTIIGAALLDDPRLSVYKRDVLQNLLNKPIETLRHYAKGKDDASLFDVISFIVKETCSEIVDLTVYESTSDTNLFHITSGDVTADTPDDDEILVTATPDEVILDTTDVTPTSMTTLKDQVITSEKIIDEAIVATLRTPDKYGPTGPVLSTTVQSDDSSPTRKPVEDEAYFNQIIDNSEQNLLASDMTAKFKSVETFWLATTNTVKHNSALPKSVVVTSNSFETFSDDTDEDVKDEDSTYAHCNMGQSVSTHDQPSVTKTKEKPTKYRFSPNGHEIIEEIIDSLRNDPISDEDLTWWMSYARKEIGQCHSPSCSQETQQTSLSGSIVSVDDEKWKPDLLDELLALAGDDATLDQTAFSQTIMNMKASCEETYPEAFESFVDSIIVLLKARKEIVEPVRRPHKKALLCMERLYNLSETARRLDAGKEMKRRENYDQENSISTKIEPSPAQIRLFNLARAMQEEGKLRRNRNRMEKNLGLHVQTFKTKVHGSQSSSVLTGITDSTESFVTNGFNDVSLPEDDQIIVLLLSDETNTESDKENMPDQEHISVFLPPNVESDQGACIDTVQQKHVSLYPLPLPTDMLDQGAHSFNDGEVVISEVDGNFEIEFSFDVSHDTLDQNEKQFEDPSVLECEYSNEAFVSFVLEDITSDNMINEGPAERQPTPNDTGNALNDRVSSKSDDKGSKSNNTNGVEKELQEAVPRTDGMVEEAKSARKPLKKMPRHIRLYELSTKKQISGAQRRKQVEKEHLERSPPPPPEPGTVFTRSSLLRVYSSFHEETWKQHKQQE